MIEQGRKARLLLAAATIALTSAATAHAQSSEASAAQALFDDAKSLMAKGNYHAACPKLEESQRLDPALGTLLNLADCREKDGKIASAWSAFRDAEGVARHGGHAEPERVAHARAQALAARVPRLVVQVASPAPGLRITRNGVEVGAPQWGTPIPLDPGEYVLVATAPGYRPFRISAALEDGGKTVTVVIDPLQPDAATSPVAGVSEASPAPSSASRVPVATWILGGVGVAALGTTAALGLWAKSEYDDADCPNHACNSQEALDARNAAYTKASIANVTFAVGAAALAGSITVWALQPKHSNTGTTRHIELRAGLGSFAVSGAL